MRTQVAGGSLAALFLLSIVTSATAAGINPEMPSVRASSQVQKVALNQADETKTAAVVEKKPSPARPTLVATINLSTQSMSVSSNGRPLYTWRISSGRSGYETPRGTFRPGWMARTWHSRKYNMAPMPYSVFFNGGIATHGTTAVGRLGSPASHGCIRLHTAHARSFFNLVKSHGMSRTRIIVKGRTKTTRYVSRGNSRSTTRHRVDARTYDRRRSLGVVRQTARSYNRTPVYRPQARVYRQRQSVYRAPRRLIYPGDRY